MSEAQAPAKSGKINTAQLIRQVADRTRYPQYVTKEIVYELLSLIRNSVRDGHKVLLRKFGTFEKVERKSRPGRNPLTGDSLRIPARRVPRFRPGTEFRRLANRRSKSDK